MNTQYGAYAQSGFTGQQPNNVNGMQPATPNHNNIHPATAVARGALHRQQNVPYGALDFAAQQLVDGNGNGIHQNMTFRNRQGTPAQLAHGNAHPVQNGPRAQLDFVGQQVFDLDGDEVAMAVAADPSALAGFAQLRIAIIQQRARSQSTQNHQENQYHQSHQVQQQKQQHHQNYNGGGVSNFIPTPPGSAGSSCENLPVVDQNATGTELTNEFQELVNGLVAQRGTAFGGHIRSDADVARFEKAIWVAKSKGGRLENKCADFPDDEAERSEIVRRIFDAIVNTEGDQDLATGAAANGDCLAVRVIKGMSPLEIEVLAKKLMDQSVKVQRGEVVLPPHFKVVQEDNLTAKVDKVVEALSHNKALCRSATTTAEWIARIAADPVGERGQKNFNQNNNRAKNIVLKADAQMKGKSRVKGNNKGKGKGKRTAEAEVEAESSRGSPDEDVNGANNSAEPSQSRPTKRARTTRTAAQTTQPNTQQVQQKRTAVDSNNGRASTPPVNTVQGATNPNQGAVGPTNNINHGSGQESQQTVSPFVFSQNNQENFDPNFSGFAQEFQPIDVADNSQLLNQIDGANNLSPGAAAIQNDGLERAQSQSDFSNEWMAYLNSDPMDGLDFDFSLNLAPQDDSAANQQVLSAQQQNPQQPAQHQPAQNQSVPQQQQAAQEQQLQQHQNIEAPAQEQVNDSFFGELSYEQLEAQLAPLARFNAGD